ncbi:unnamed protein product [Chrysoparadoxa australica]
MRRAVFLASLTLSTSLAFLQGPTSVLPHLGPKVKPISMLPPTEVVAAGTYTPPDLASIKNFPLIVGGCGLCVVTYLWAAYEFGSRIVTQRKCAVCQGSGLVSFNKKGQPLTNQRKCYACGGFLPWVSWQGFWMGSVTDMGNGGILRRPARDYDELNQAARERLGQEEDPSD